MKASLLVLTVAALIAWPFSAKAMPTGCVDKRETVIAHLAKKYSETLKYRAYTNTGNIVEFFVSPHGATWTMMFIHPHNGYCMGGSGEYWEIVPIKPERVKVKG